MDRRDAAHQARESAVMSLTPEGVERLPASGDAGFLVGVGISQSPSTFLNRFALPTGRPTHGDTDDGCDMSVVPPRPTIHYSRYSSRLVPTTPMRHHPRVARHRRGAGTLDGFGRSCCCAT
jgi:hypothetical protein